jgi:hypothetical protein
MRIRLGGLTQGQTTPSLRGIGLGPEFRLTSVNKDPSDPGVNLCIVQFGGKGTVGTTWPQIHPYCHLPSPKWLNAMVDEDP